MEQFVNMSYMYYSVLGTVVTVSVGCIVSLCTETKEYDSKLIHPMLARRSDAINEKHLSKEREANGLPLPISVSAVSLQPTEKY